MGSKSIGETMKKELLDEISKEIIKLQSEDYRREVKMWANEKQIKKLKKLFSRVGVLMSLSFLLGGCQSVFPYNVVVRNIGQKGFDDAQVKFGERTFSVRCYFIFAKKRYSP